MAKTGSKANSNSKQVAAKATEKKITKPKEVKLTAK